MGQEASKFDPNVKVQVIESGMSGQELRPSAKLEGSWSEGQSTTVAVSLSGRARNICAIGSKYANARRSKTEQT
jgi:hypothetical protein